jgi:hypothetical protein
LSAGTVGGIATVGSVAAVAASLFLGPVIDPTPFNLLAVAMAGVGGIVALARPREVEALVVADVFVGFAVATGMYSRGGMVFLPALLLLIAGTARSRSKEEIDQLGSGAVPEVLVVRNVTPEPDELRKAG